MNQIQIDQVISSYLQQENQNIQDILQNFKTQKCSIQEKHQQDCCDKYHDEKDKRRNPLPSFYGPKQFGYSSVLCEDLQCDTHNCQFCLNKYELRYHPLNYKTKKCENYNQCQIPFCPNFHQYEQKRFINELQSQNENQYQSQQYPNLQLSNININSNNNNQQINKFDLNTFKTVRCTKTEQHNLKHCLFYHNDHDRRRPPQQYEYTCDICPNQHNCDRKDNCCFSHNKVEQLYHVARYKSKFCQKYNRERKQITKCEYGDYCGFAHNEDEITIELIEKCQRNTLEANTEFNIYKYKTIWCPYTFQHDRGSCVYAHNVQDYRRDPKKFILQPIECPNWGKSENIQLYAQGGCKNLLNCDKCHGWKENEYHPQVYKTTPCKSMENCKKKDCVYYHQNRKDQNIQFANAYKEFASQMSQNVQLNQQIAQQQQMYQMQQTQLDQTKANNNGQPLGVFVSVSAQSSQNNKSMNKKHQKGNRDNGNGYYQQNKYQPKNQKKNYTQQQRQNPEYYNSNQQLYQENSHQQYCDETSYNTSTFSQKSSFNTRDNSQDSNFLSSNTNNSIHTQNQFISNIYQGFSNNNIQSQYMSDGEIEKKKNNSKKMNAQCKQYYPNSINDFIGQPLTKTYNENLYKNMQRNNKQSNILQNLKINKVNQNNYINSFQNSNNGIFSNNGNCNINFFNQNQNENYQNLEYKDSKTCPTSPSLQSQKHSDIIFNVEEYSNDFISFFERKGHKNILAALSQQGYKQNKILELSNNNLIKKIEFLENEEKIQLQKLLVDFQEDELDSDLLKKANITEENPYYQTQNFPMFQQYQNQD